MQPWLDWAKQIKAIAQAGETYGRDKYDLERYRQLDEIAHQMFAHLSGSSVEQVQKLFIPESGYPTPKIDLRAAVIKDGKILLVREKERIIAGRYPVVGVMYVKHRKQVLCVKYWKSRVMW